MVTTAGAFDVLVELVCEDDDQLFTLLNDRIRALAGVWAVEAFVYLRLNKQHYDWGTR
ncbi:MAG: Lrp/AsnC ligand binding domain-containing protein [Micropruina glycogenica]